MERCNPRPIERERQIACFRGVAFRCSCSLRVRTSSCRGGNIYLVVDSAMLHYRDFGAVWIIHILYTELVHLYRSSVSILCVSVRVDVDLPCHDVHKRPRCRVTLDIEYAMAADPASHHSRSVLSGRGLRGDKT